MKLNVEQLRALLCKKILKDPKNQKKKKKDPQFLLQFNVNIDFRGVESYVLWSVTKIEFANTWDKTSQEQSKFKFQKPVQTSKVSKKNYL